MIPKSQRCKRRIKYTKRSAERIALNIELASGIRMTSNYCELCKMYHVSKVKI